MPGARLNFVSLFCGAGGFDLGFIQKGFRCVGAYDIDPLAVKVHRENLNSSAEICDLSVPSFSPAHRIGIDVLLASPPCQGFSTAGRRFLNDPRNNLLLIGGRLALLLRPTVFVAENVTGVISGEHGTYWSTLREMLVSAGYIVGDTCCDASKVGVPQVRKRMVMIACKKKKLFNIRLNGIHGGVLRDAFANLDGTAGHVIRLLNPYSHLARIARHIKPGQKLCNVRGGPRSVHTWEIPEVFGRTTEEERQILNILLRLRRRSRVRSVGDADPVMCSAISAEFGKSANTLLLGLIKKGFVRRIGSRYDLRHTFNGKFRRLRWDEPSPTVHTRFGDPKYFLHPDQERGFTVREAARIQGFPDSFTFFGSDREQYRLIGNAVPPPLASCIAEFLREVLLV